MKKILFALFAVLIIIGGLSSCKKLAAAIFGGTNVVVPDVQVTIPAIVVVSPSELGLGSYSYYFNLDSAVRANTAGIFGAKAVSSIKIKQMTITITNADQLNNLSNFESARVTLQSDVNNTPVEIFSKTFADTYAESVTSTPTNNPELLSYLKGSQIVYNMFGKNRRITTKTLNITVSVILKAS